MGQGPAVLLWRERALAGLSTTLRLELAMPVSWGIRLYRKL